MDDLDKKLNEVYPGRVVRKDLLHRIKKGTNVPSFVLEFLLARYCASDDPDESTVGVQVEVDHLAATPIDQRVTCTARVINTDGRLVTFQLEARDQQERVARGLHKLSVIHCDRFASRVQAKMKVHDNSG